MALTFVSGQVAANGINDANTTIAVAFPSNVGSGNLLVVTTCSAAVSQTITDDLGDAGAWTERSTVTNPDGRVIKEFEKVTTAAGACTVTLTVGVGQRRGLSIREFTGNHASPFDQQATGSGTDNSLECGSVTMTADGCIVVGMGGYSAGILTLDTDYTELIENNTALFGSCHRVTTAITDEAVHSKTGTQPWGAVTCSYIEAGGGGGGLPTPVPVSISTLFIAGMP